jgi:hypothetical protein
MDAQRAWETANGMNGEAGSAAQAEESKLATERQWSAIRRLRRHVEEHMRDQHIATFEKQVVGDTVIVSITVESTKDHALLKMLDHEFWLATIGPRGAITLKSAPKSYQQFNGKRAFGMNVRLM